jgi:delta 1-pyrroline-5-carboxylate dehydrogenase
MARTRKRAPRARHLLVAAQTFALATLELGGKGAAILFDDMDLDRAVNGAAFAAFIGTEQTCVCGARILVQESIYPTFVKKFKAKIASIRVGDPADIRTRPGPVSSERSRARILAMFERGSPRARRCWGAVAFQNTCGTRASTLSPPDVRLLRCASNASVSLMLRPNPAALRVGQTSDERGMSSRRTQRSLCRMA